MKPIKSDLPLNGQKISNLEQLEENLTPEILEHFRSGKLTRWLRVRSLNEQAEAVEMLMTKNNEHELLLFKSLSELFVNTIDENNAREIIEQYNESKYIKFDESTYNTDELTTIDVKEYTYNCGGNVSFKNVDHGINRAIELCTDSVIACYQHWCILSLTPSEVSQFNSWLLRIKDTKPDGSFVKHLVNSLDYSSGLSENIKNVIKQSINDMFYKFVNLCSNKLKEPILAVLDNKNISKLADNHTMIYQELDRLFDLVFKTEEDVAKAHSVIARALKEEVLAKFNIIKEYKEPLVNNLISKQGIEFTTIAHIGWVRSLYKMLYINCGVLVDPNNNEITIDKNDPSAISNIELNDLIHSVFNSSKLDDYRDLHQGFTINLISISGQVFTVYRSYSTLGYWYAEPKAFNVI